MYYCFASTNRGMEALLIEEIKSLGATEILSTNAGAQFSADMTTIMKINLHSRFASRIMLQVAFSEYHDADDIYKLAHTINWQEWFNSKNTIKVSTTAIHSPLKSLDFVTLKVKDAICDSFMELDNLRPDVNKLNPDIRIYNFLTNDTVTIYIDTSGNALFKRGYRENKLEAPLKENLAAGLLTLSNWSSSVTLFDPMCGSGTIIIEAISQGLNIAPGFMREFSFELFKNFDKKSWNELKKNAFDSIKWKNKLSLFANDKNMKAIHIARDNLMQFELMLRSSCNKFNLDNQSINLMNLVKFSNFDLLNMKAPSDSGIMVTNPPYGVRLDELDELAEFYPKLASILKNNFAGWNCYFLTADLRMPKLMRLKPTRKTPLFNGALDCRLFELKMVAGSNRN